MGSLVVMQIGFHLLTKKTSHYVFWLAVKFSVIIYTSITTLLQACMAIESLNKCVERYSQFC